MGMPYPKTARSTSRCRSRAPASQRRPLGLLFPQGKPQGKGLRPSDTRIDEKTAAEARRKGLDPSVLWVVEENEAEIRDLPVRPGQTMQAQFVYELGPVPKGSTWRFSALSRLGKQVIGGSIWYLRVK